MLFFVKLSLHSLHKERRNTDNKRLSCACSFWFFFGSKIMRWMFVIVFTVVHNKLSRSIILWKFVHLVKQRLGNMITMRRWCISGRGISLLKYVFNNKERIGFHQQNVKFPGSNSSLLPKFHSFQQWVKMAEPNFQYVCSNTCYAS